MDSDGVPGVHAPGTPVERLVTGHPAPVTGALSPSRPEPLVSSRSSDPLVSSRSS
jgi:hypothetical protein